MEYSFIITAWNEAETVKQTVHNVINQEYGNMLNSMEIILVSPDLETYEAAKKVIDTYGFQNFEHIQDPKKGKPHALNLALEKACGEILIFIDGDVVIGENALPVLVDGFKDSKIGGITGRPISADTKKTMLGYWGNLLADAAHHKRTLEFKNERFYFLSGYLYAMRNCKDIRFPEGLLVDDGWVTIELIKRGFTLGYEPEAKVFVKYPRTFSDWIKQKKRSIGGYNQLRMYEHKAFSEINVLAKTNRTLKDELAFAIFPLKYAKNIPELIFSIALFPARLYLWWIIFYERTFVKKSFEEMWVRIESTK